MIADLHNDFITSDSYVETLKKYRSRSDLIVCAVFKGKRDYDACYRLASDFAAKKSENLYLSFEDFSYRVSFSDLEKLLDLKPFCVGLTWNGDSVLGGGAGSDAGLTARGKDVIKLLNEKNVFVDLAHLSRKSFFEALDLADRAICTHTAFDAVSKHKRNLSFDQLKALVGRGVLVGLCFYPYFLSGKNTATVGDFIKHVSYYTDNFGDDGLCVGSDLFGCEVYADGLCDYDCERFLIESLKNAGIGDRSVDKILYKNARDVLTRRFDAII